MRLEGGSCWVWGTSRAGYHLHNNGAEYYIYGKMAKREDIDNEQEGSKDRTLGYTRGEGGKIGI